MGSGKEESAGEGGDGADPPKTLVAKFILQADQQIMKMIEKDDSFEGLRVKKANKSWLWSLESGVRQIWATKAPPHPCQPVWVVGGDPKNTG
jgi:hypothetical protein